ncbi:beta-propeller fold lactonase family protein [Actinoplanes lobatus]|uniref:YVTN family beta-propeller protein n=1 Tax=Actinoplanes lobatus TaxID=113568 RepID=A0A7W7MHY7_9ACTN|nr:beta-propeller fold lactonase family protein [Actinoplanes lobatus]MBB4750450.1 YVTN family beta-propeller protein [Actinoplanes lobatus]
MRRFSVPSADVPAFVDVLGEPALGGFDVTYLRDPGAREAYSRTKSIFDGREQDDCVLVYFRGVMLTGPGGGLYLATADTVMGRPTDTAIDVAQMAVLMQRSRAGQAVVLLDGRTGSPVDAGHHFRAARAAEWQSRVVIAATARPEPPTFAGLIADGVVTGAADRDRDGWIGIGELHDHLRERDPSVRQWVFGSGRQPYLARIRRQGSDQMAQIAQLAVAAAGDDLSRAVEARSSLQRLATGEGRVAAAASAALRRTSVRLAEPAVDFGRVAPGTRQLAAVVAVQGPPLAAASAVSSDAEGLHARLEGNVLRVSWFPTVGRLDGAVTLDGPAGSARLTVTGEVATDFDVATGGWVPAPGGNGTQAALPAAPPTGGGPVAGGFSPPGSPAAGSTPTSGAGPHAVSPAPSSGAGPHAVPPVPSSGAGPHTSPSGGGFVPPAAGSPAAAWEAAWAAGGQPWPGETPTPEEAWPGETAWPGEVRNQPRQTPDPAAAPGEAAPPAQPGSGAGSPAAWPSGGSGDKNPDPSSGTAEAVPPTAGSPGWAPTSGSPAWSPTSGPPVRSTPPPAVGGTAPHPDAPAGASPVQGRPADVSPWVRSDQTPRPEPAGQTPATPTAEGSLSGLPADASPRVSPEKAPGSGDAAGPRTAAWTSPWAPTSGPPSSSRSAALSAGQSGAAASFESTVRPADEPSVDSGAGTNSDTSAVERSDVRGGEPEAALPETESSGPSGDEPLVAPRATVRGSFPVAAADTPAAPPGPAATTGPEAGWDSTTAASATPVFIEEPSAGPGQRDDVTVSPAGESEPDHADDIFPAHPAAGSGSTEDPAPRPDPADPVTASHDTSGPDRPAATATDSATASHDTSGPDRTTATTDSATASDDNSGPDGEQAAVSVAEEAAAGSSAGAQPDVNATGPTTAESPDAARSASSEPGAASDTPASGVADSAVDRPGKPAAADGGGWPVPGSSWGSQESDPDGLWPSAGRKPGQGSAVTDAAGTAGAVAGGAVAAGTAGAVAAGTAGAVAAGASAAAAAEGTHPSETNADSAVNAGGEVGSAQEETSADLEERGTEGPEPGSADDGDRGPVEESSAGPAGPWPGRTSGNGVSIPAQRQPAEENGPWLVPSAQGESAAERGGFAEAGAARGFAGEPQPPGWSGTDQQGTPARPRVASTAGPGAEAGTGAADTGSGPAGAEPAGGGAAGWPTSPAGGWPTSPATAWPGSDPWAQAQPAADPWAPAQPAADPWAQAQPGAAQAPGTAHPDDQTTGTYDAGYPSGQAGTGYGPAGGPGTTVYGQGGGPGAGGHGQGGVRGGGHGGPPRVTYEDGTGFGGSGPYGEEGGKPPRKRLALVAGVLVALLLLAGATYAGVRFVLKSDEPEAASQNPAPTQSAPGQTAGAAPTGPATEPAGTQQPAAPPSLAKPVVLEQIRLGREPEGVAVSPDNRTLYVADQDSKDVHFVDVQSKQVSAVKVPNTPRFLALSADGGRLYVSLFENDFTGNGLAVIDTANKTLVKTIRTGPRPFEPAVAPDGKVWLPIHNGARVEIYDDKTLTEAARISVPPNPHWIVFTPDGQTAFTANHESSQISVVSVADRLVRKNFKVGKSPHALAVTPDGKQLVATNYDLDTVEVYDTGNQRLIHRVVVGKEPQAVMISGDSRHAYIVNEGSDNLSVIDLSTGKVVSTIGVGDSPRVNALSPDGKRLYVTDGRGKTVTVLRVSEE